MVHPLSFWINIHYHLLFGKKGVGEGKMALTTLRVCMRVFQVHVLTAQGALVQESALTCQGYQLDQGLLSYFFLSLFLLGKMLGNGNWVALLSLILTYVCCGTKALFVCVCVLRTLISLCSIQARV